MATVACKCGEKFHPSPEHYGKEVKCRRCGRMVKLIPDPSFDAPPKPQTGAFTQTFTNSAPPPPPPPRYTAPAPPPAPAAAPPAPPAPATDPHAPPGLHPELRKILIYAAVICGLISAALIFKAFHGNAPPPPEPVQDF